ncbi:MAG: hypothetical protein ACSHX3_08355 [Litorimonas sp.]
MASIRKITNTPTLVSITKTRRTRADNLPISVAQSIDTPPERREGLDRRAETPHTPSAFDDVLSEAPQEQVLSDKRPVFERLDRTKDVAGSLGKEKPDHEDRAMQAMEAYKTLRQPDEEKTPVGTA